MANHYYDFEIDDCPIHEDKDTNQFYRLELVLPIGHTGINDGQTCFKYLGEE